MDICPNMQVCFPVLFAFPTYDCKYFFFSPQSFSIHILEQLGFQVVLQLGLEFTSFLYTAASLTAAAPNPHSFDILRVMQGFTVGRGQKKKKKKSHLALFSAEWIVKP